MNRLLLLAPTLSLSAFAFILFGVDTLKGGGSRKIAFWIALLGLAVTAALVRPSGLMAPISFGRGMLVADPLSFFLTCIALTTAFFVILLTEQDQQLKGQPLAAFYGLLLLAIVGLILVSSANDFLMIFLAIELVGVPGFILTGYLRHVEKSGEGAIKFFLIGAFSSAMLAYGISILYGLTGSTSLASLQSGALLTPEKAPLALVAIFFVLVSFGFKIALVPFHMWVPDAFEGAPTPVAAFLSVAPKIAGIAIAMRVFNLSLPSAQLGAVNVLVILAALTMTIANVIGLWQTNVVRLLAYSSIAHMGYMLLGLIAGGPTGMASVYFYGGAYLFMNLGAFAVVICLANALHSSDLTAFAGLGKKAPILSALFVLFLISLAGIPPTVGFIAKFYIFWAAFNAGWTWLVVLAAINSVISAAYYFKILRAMYFQSPASEAPIAMDFSMRLTLAATSFITLFAGVFPQCAFAKAERLAAPPAVSQLASASSVSVSTGTTVQP